jgi:hypothetical protein
MSKLDLAKEQIAYLEMWLGIAVAAGLSLIGWTASKRRVGFSPPAVSRNAEMVG